MEIKLFTDGHREEKLASLGVRLLTRQDVEGLITMEEAIAAVERGFRLLAAGACAMPPKIYLDVPGHHGDFRAMPAYIEDVAGLKWVSVYPENPRRELPSVLATIILCDPATGVPLAIMDGTFITGLRTGAAGGVAVKYLARPDAATVGLVGAGAQARLQLLAISRVRPHLADIRVFDVRPEASARFAREMGEMLGLSITPVASAVAAAEADIVVTVTPARAPVVPETAIRPGTHINAIGADAPGKQELASAILQGARLFVDSHEQACHSGEVNVPLARGEITRGHIAGTLGEVITGKLPGRQRATEVTVFDSTGLAIQDLVCAKLAYDKAVAQAGARSPFPGIIP